MLILCTLASHGISAERIGVQLPRALRAEGVRADARVGPRGAAYFCNSHQQLPSIAACSFARNGQGASLNSTRCPTAQKVAHGKLHALIAQNAVGRGHVIEEVGDCERNQKLPSAGAHRATRVLDHDRSIKAGFKIAWRNRSKICDRRIQAPIQILNALCIVRGRR